TKALIYADEFRALLQVARRQTTSDLIPKLNTLYGCPAVDGIDRRQEPAKVIRPFVSLIAGSPKGWLEDAFERGDISGGFLNRMLFFVGVEKRAIPFPSPPDPLRWSRFICEVLDVLNV